MSKVKVKVGRDRSVQVLKGTELNMLPIFIKGIVHPKILILSLFTRCHVVPNLY